MGGDNGEPWSSDGLILPGIGLVSPRAKESLRSVPGIISQLLQAGELAGAQQSAQHPMPGAVWKVILADPEEHYEVKGLLAPKSKINHPPESDNNINLISHWGLLLVPKGALLCLALDSSD